MTPIAPIAIAALGAGLDALPTAAGVTGLWVSMGPQLLVAKVRVTGATADLRLYCYDADLLRWVPSAVPVATVAVGVSELRFVAAEISGLYALVQEAGAGVVSYVLRPGRA